MAWFRDMKISLKLLAAFILVAMLTAGVGYMGISQLKVIDDNDTILYERMTVPISQMGDISTAFQRMRVNLRDLMLADNDAARQDQMNRIMERRAEIDKNMAAFEKSIISGEMKAAYENLKQARAVYYPILDQLVSLERAGRDAEVRALITGVGAKAATDMQSAIDKIVDMKVADAKDKSEGNTVIANNAIRNMTILIVVCFFLAIALGMFIAREISRPVRRLLVAADKLALGDVNVSLDSGAKDEIGLLTTSFAAMAVNVRNAALALEKVSAGDINVQIKVHSEQDLLGNSLIKMVETVAGLIKETDNLVQATKQGQLDRRGNAAAFSGEWGTLVGGVNQMVDAFVGPINVTAEYVDRISKGDIPPKITDTYHGDFNEIKNNLNNCIDTMNGLLKETDSLIQATKQGQLDRRGNAAAFSGEWGTLVGGVNQLVDAFVGPINVTAEYVDRISKGDIPPKITDTYHGDFNEIKNNLNNCIDTMNGLLKETGELIAATKQGQLDRRGNAAAFSGEWGTLVGGVNQLVDAFVGPINVTAEYVDRISKGDIPPKITDTYHGDFNEIKNNLNNCIDNISALVIDADLLVQAAVAGKLATRADATKHGGDYRKIVEGVNRTLDAVIGPLNVAADYVDKISQGNIPEKISDAYNGDFNTIKNNLNNCIDNINLLVIDANMLAEAAVAGRLATRADATKHGGDYRKIVEGVNRTLDAVIGPLNVAARYVEQISKGDIPPKITDTYHGDFNEIKNNLNDCIDNINALVTDADLLVQAAVAGRLSTRADATKHGGDYRKIVEGVNRTLDAVIGPLNVAARYVEQISKGDIPSKITDTYHGDFNEIKNNLNSCIDNINALVTDADLLVQAAIEGKLATRADATKHGGDYRKIVEGVNRTLDAVIGPLNVAASYVERISKGDIPPQIVDSYNGDFNTIKNNLNVCIAAVKSLVEDSNMLADAALEGRLNTRADAGRHSGDFRRIVDGVNNTLDSVLEPIKEAASCLEEIAKGNLDTEVKGEYKGDHAMIKQALNQSLDSINEVLNQVNIAVDQVAAGSRQVSDSSQALSNGATQSASAVEEISSSMHEMAAQTNQNADNANQASQLSTMARDQAEKGNEQMNNMVKAMDDINQSATNISKIIKVIDEIAFQTNLLALNAAVEAARAGKHGKGFTVVAEEVRNLAQRSAKAAKETTEMIEDSIKRTEVGTKIAQDTAESLGEIVRGAVKVTDLISEIAAASREQAQGINQINQALGQVDQVTQQNTASAEESAAASEELSSQAMQLKETVGKFRLRRLERHAAPSEFSGRRSEQFVRPRSAPANKSMMHGEPINIHLDDKDFGNF